MTSAHKPTKVRPQSRPTPNHVIPKSEDGQRLDRYLKNTFPALPFGAIQKLLRTGQIRVLNEDGASRAKPDTRLIAGDALRLPPSLHTQPGQASPANAHKHSNYVLTNADRTLMKTSILLEDDAILVLNKPAGLAAQAGNGVTRSLDRILAAIYGLENAPKLAHRLDRDTTGVIVLGKTRAAAASLTKQFQQHTNEKTYLALLTGQLEEGQGDIMAPLLKKEIDGGARVVVSPQGDAAHTSWKLVKFIEDENERNLHLVTAVPHTGRMNQLRAHFAHIAAPIVGDAKYGGPPARNVSREVCRAAHQYADETAPLFLHAWKLSFSHPTSGETLNITAPLPPHFARLSGE